MKIGITGSIACGKSKICEYLQNNGYEVIDADKISYSLTQKGNLCYNKVILEFGEEILQTNGQIDRKKLGQMVFSDSLKKEKLEKIIHPAVIDFIKNYEEKEIVFFEVPLLYEAKMESLFSKIIVVYCNKETQIKRLMERNSFTLEEANLRINSQMDLQKKVEKADYVIDNSYTLDLSIKKVNEVLKEILKIN